MKQIEGLERLDELKNLGCISSLNNMKKLKKINIEGTYLIQEGIEKLKKVEKVYTNDKYSETVYGILIIFILFFLILIW